MPFYPTNRDFEAVDVSTEPGAYLASGVGTNLPIGGWIFEAAPQPYADSINDFSGVQGGASWRYGHTTDPASPGAFSTSNMTFSGFWMGDGTLGVDDTPWFYPYGQVAALSVGTEKHAVRRWTSDVTTTVSVMGYCQGKLTFEPSGGMTVSVRKNGVVLWSEIIDPGDTVPRRIEASTSVSTGDHIDVVVTSTGSSGIDNFVNLRVTIFSGGQSGIVHPSSVWASGIFGDQTVMIQGAGKFYQDITAPRGNYKARFKAWATDAFTLQVLLDGVVLTEMSPSTDPDLVESETDFFDWPAGTHRLGFRASGPNNEELYIDEIDLSGTFYFTETEESDSGQAISNANRGRRAADVSSSIELACRNITVIRSEIEGSISNETRNLGVGNPYIPHGGTIGSNPGVIIDVIYWINQSELNNSGEGYAVWSNGELIRDSLCHVDPISNLALDKAATASSLLPGNLASSGNDGITGGEAGTNTIVHTDLEQSPWWQVDLGVVSEIHTIKLWNRTDICCAFRTANFYIFVSEAPFASNDLATTIADPSVWKVFQAAQAGAPSTFEVNVPGRFVRLQLQDEQYLNFAELEVFGR